MLYSDLPSRSLGVESECAMPFLGNGGNRDIQDQVAEIFRRNGITATARPYSHSAVTTDYAVEYDSSVTYHDAPFQGLRVAQLECKTRVMHGVADASTIIPKALSILRFMGGRVNTTTGTHVHVGLPEVQDDARVIRSVWNLIHKYQHVIFALCPPSRVNNRFCKALPAAPRFLHGWRSLRQFQDRLASIDRQHCINFANLWGTNPHLEFRFFGGSLNGEKVLHYATMASRLVEHAVTRSCQAAPQPLENSRDSLESFLVTCGFKVNSGIYSKVDPQVRATGRWILSRWNGRGDSE